MPHSPSAGPRVPPHRRGRARNPGLALRPLRPRCSSLVSCPARRHHPAAAHLPASAQARSVSWHQLSGAVAAAAPPCWRAADARLGVRLPDVLQLRTPLPSYHPGWHHLAGCPRATALLACLGLPCSTGAGGQAGTLHEGAGTRGAHCNRTASDLPVHLRLLSACCPACAGLFKASRPLISGAGLKGAVSDVKRAKTAIDNASIRQ